jgi:chromosome segregation ATPase
MAQSTSRVQDGVDQIRSAVRRFDRQLRKLQRRVESRRKEFGKQITSRRKALERRAQKELTRVQRELSRRPIVKRAESLRADARSRLEHGVSSVLGSLPIATRGEIERIDRKLRALDRKLRELEKNQDVGAAA